MTKEQKIIFWQVTLFIITFITTTLAGAEWIYGKYFFMNEQGFGWNDWLTWDKIVHALTFSTAFLGILTVHEFGHYLMARKHGIQTTLPYYIPMWFGLGSSIGTLGAFIRIKDRVRTREQFFDIGISGPLAGFAIAVGVLWYGFTHLPPPEYIFTIHPEYEQYGLDYANYVYNTEGAFYLGKNLIFLFFENYVAPAGLAPNAYELMHYPWLFAGYLACFFTALNLMPIGQLDGGHILYGLLGYKWHSRLSVALFIAFVFYAGLGIITPYQISNITDWSILLYLIFLYVVFRKIGGNSANTFLLAFSVLTAQFATSYFFPYIKGYNGWLVFAFVLGRFLGVYHPGALYDRPLNAQRKILGWISLVIFILCFTPQPFVFE